MSRQIISSDNKHPLHHTFYSPEDGDVKATLLIAHGMAEHSGRYSDFAQYLTDNGIAVLTYDHLGHGHTASSPDELGYFNKHPMQTLLQDTVIMANAIKARYPDVPHFIMGHSMGSFMVRTVLQHHYQDFNGAILMGTSDTDPLVNVLHPVAKALNTLKPKSTNPIFAKTTNFIMNSKLKDKKSDSQYAWLAKNEDAIKDYESDPLCGFDFTNNGFFGLFSLMNQGLATDWAQTIDKDFPMVFVSGKDDPVGNMSKGINKLIKRMTKKQGFSNIQKHLYDNMRHEPLHEAYPEPVYHDILAWILARVE